MIRSIFLYLPFGVLGLFTKQLEVITSQFRRKNIQNPRDTYPLMVPYDNTRHHMTTHDVITDKNCPIL